MPLYACSSVWQMKDGNFKQALNICIAKNKEEAMGIHIDTCKHRDKGAMAGLTHVEADYDFCASLSNYMEELEAEGERRLV